MAKLLHIGLAGNPNCGKTTLFNALTGSNQYVGNWPGVTVEKKDGRLVRHEEVVLQDLPGTYSLSPYSQDEVVTRNYLLNDRPDAIINIVDGTNIERNLYLTTQLLELNLPMVVAVNMMDLFNRNGDKLDPELLSQELGCPVLPISALTGEGLEKLEEVAIRQASQSQVSERPHIYSGSVEHAIAHIEESIQDQVEERNLRWYAVKVFERDEKVLHALSLSPDVLEHLEKHIQDCERELDDQADGIITNQRYASIASFLDRAVVRKNADGGLTTSDKIDLVVTSRVFALPIFALLIWAMYYISVTTVGAWLTRWVNDGVFGEGWFLPWTEARFLQDQTEYAEATCLARPVTPGEFEAMRQKLPASPSQSASGALVPYTQATPAAAGSPERPLTLPQMEAIAAYLRYPSLQDMPAQALPHFLQDHGLAGLGLLPGEGQTWEVRGVTEEEQEQARRLLASRPSPQPQEYPGWIPGIPVMARRLLERLGAGEIVQSLVMDAAIGGVGTVLGFVPQILLVFLFLAFLEDCGYMSRVAFIMDRLLRRFGLSGKSFIPMIVGAGCGVPAIMAARTIENEKDRRMTIMLSTFIPCGAKMEVVAMITLACFPGSMWVAPSMYFIGVAIIVMAGIALKKTRPFSGEPAPFVLELPAYHLPTLRNLLLHTWDRGKDFCIKAGTVIFLACLFLWTLHAFSWDLHFVGTDVDRSILAHIGRLFSWFFRPLGLGDWRGTVAILSATFAKEQATGTLGVLSHAGGESIVEVIARMFREFNPAHPELAALSFLLINLFAPPCLVAVITSFRELGHRTWGWMTVALQLGIGYSLSVVVYQLGIHYRDGAPFTWGTGFACCLLLLVLWLVLRPEQWKWRRFSRKLPEKSS
ncbi:MAG: ferrous iron transporter B [Oligosphaeraceae bacterium]